MLLLKDPESGMYEGSPPPSREERVLWWLLEAILPVALAAGERPGRKGRCDQVGKRRSCEVCQPRAFARSCSGARDLVAVD